MRGYYISHLWRREPAFSSSRNGSRFHNRMKVLYLSACGQLGGAEKSLLDIFASMRAAKPDWPLQLVSGEDGPLVSQSRALGVSATIVPFPASLARMGDAAAGGPAGHHQSRLSLLAELLAMAPQIFSYVRKLRCVIRELAPEVIHSNGFKMHVLGIWAKPQGVPIIWHIHDYVSARSLMTHLLRHYAPHCELAVANSRSVAADVTAVCGSRLQVKTVYNGIDLDCFTPGGPTLDLDALSGLSAAPPETIRVGMLATLAKWKGHETFLRAVALIPAELRVRGYVIGGALYQTNGSQHSLAELQGWAAKLGVSDRVGFTGFLDDPAPAVRALDIVVHASTQPEPFGLVIVEGMACGRAVIVSEGGGARELVDLDVNALGHPPGDATRLAKLIALLATNRSLRARLGAAARTTAEQHFNRTRLATELIPIYRGLTNGSHLQSAARDPMIAK